MKFNTDIWSGGKCKMGKGTNASQYTETVLQVNKAIIEVKIFYKYFHVGKCIIRQYQYNTTRNPIGISEETNLLP